MEESQQNNDGREEAESADAFTVDGVLLCPSCQANFPPSEQNFVIYFSADDLRCPSCRTTLDWWAMARDALAKGFLGLQYAPIRSRSTHTQVTMKANESLRVEPTRLGVPKTAQILSVNYTGADSIPPDADGTLMPLEAYSNPSERDWLPDRPLILFPMPLGSTPPVEQTIFMLIVWVDKADIDVAESSLIAAVTALGQRRYSDAVVSASGAVEVSVQQALSEFFEEFADVDRTTEMLRRIPTREQREVLLPSICGIVGAPTLPTAPAAALRGLKTLRDQAAHTGHLGGGVSQTQVAEAVSGAIFAVEHANIVKQSVNQYLNRRQ